MTMLNDELAPELSKQGMELALKGGTYSPVKVRNNDTVGALLLGVFAFVLLIAFVRSRSHDRALMQRIMNLH